MLLLVLIAEFHRQENADFVARHPPSFHGTRNFPAANTIVDMHIGSGAFEDAVANDSFVSPYVAALYHFSTAAVDWGLLVNNMVRTGDWTVNPLSATPPKTLG